MDVGEIIETLSVILIFSATLTQSFILWPLSVLVHNTQTNGIYTKLSRIWMNLHGTDAAEREEWETEAFSGRDGESSPYKKRHSV